MLLRHGTASRAWLNPLSLLDLNPLCGETSLAHVGGRMGAVMANRLSLDPGVERGWCEAPSPLPGCP